MKKLRFYPALFFVLGIIVSMTGCSVGGNSSYTVVERLETQQLCVAFRLDDRVGNAVNAALAELQAEGEVAKLSEKWFGEDRSLLKGDAEALSKLETPVEPRTLLVGYDAGHMPFSGGGTSSPEGFDVELAKKVCEKLGWRTKFVAVDVSKAEVELGSGNVDCIWGGFADDGSSKKISCSPAYMENTVIIASLNGSGVRTAKSLSDKTLAVSETGLFSSVLEKFPDVSQQAEFLAKLPGGTDACFEALKSGACDAILTDMAGIDYYE